MKKKDLFELMVSEASVYGHVALLTLGCGKAVPFGTVYTAEEIAHLMVSRTQRKRQERTWVLPLPFKGMHSMA